MPGAQYKLYVDWLNNGLADTQIDDVTARALDKRTAIMIKEGRDQSRQYFPTTPGEMVFELDDRSRDYSPENLASPIAGFVSPGRRVVLQAINGATVTTLYDGVTDGMDNKPGLSDRSLSVSCFDALGRLRGLSLSTQLYRGVRTGEAIGLLLDAAGWPTGLRDLDVGASYLPYWWMEDQDAYEGLMQLVDSEGPAALITVDGQGRIVFRDRHARLTQARSLTVQSTWRSAGIEPTISEPTVYNNGLKEIVNSATFEVPLRSADIYVTNVWTSSGILTVTAGVPLVLVARSGGPFINAITPVAGTDYTLLSGTLSVAVSRTSGQSTTITITSAGGAVLQDLVLRGTAIISTDVVVTVEDPTSVGKYGRRSLQASSGRMPVWANQYDVAAIFALLIGRRAERLPTMSVTMRGAANALRLAECLNRTLGDRVHITDTTSGLDADFFVEQIQHVIDEGGQQHVTTFGVEKIPPIVTGVFTFDVAGAGFNQGVFGGGGLDNPTTMFRFDTAGVGFNQGVFVN